VGETVGERAGVIRVAFLGALKGVSKWPNVYFDTEARARELMNVLKSRHPDVEFVGGDVVHDRESCDRLIGELGGLGEEALVLFNLASSWFVRPELVAKLPTAVISDPLLWGYAGMVSLSHAIRSTGARAFIVSSSDWADIDRAIDVIKAYLRLRRSKLLLVGRGYPGDLAPARKLGVEVEVLGYDELLEEYERASEEEAKGVAKSLVERAVRVVEPSFEEVVRSARLYLAIRRVLERRRADGIAIDCLGGFARGDLPAYPCLAFMLLDDEGRYVTACENDLDSLLTKLVMKHIAKRPGFLCEPAIDTSRGLAMYAHCVAPTRMAGYSERGEPFVIRSHAEDDKGACAQVLFRSGVPVTVTKIVPSERRVLLLKGTLLGHVDVDMGCRCKAAVRVSDAQRLIDEWQHGWHRVLLYGDWTREVEMFAKLVGYEVYREG